MSTPVSSLFTIIHDDSTSYSSLKLKLGPERSTNYSQQASHNSTGNNPMFRFFRKLSRDKSTGTTSNSTKSTTARPFVPDVAMQQSDTAELQEDSFITFSVGHLNQKPVSLVKIAKYARIIAQADDFSDESFGFYRKRRWNRRGKKRSNNRRRQKNSSSLSDHKFSPILAPLRRCFYY